MRNKIKISLIAGSMMLITSSLQANSYGMSGDYATGNTVWPNMFGGVSSGNPAEIGIQQNIKLSTIKNRDSVAKLKVDCKLKKETLEKDYKDVSGFFSKAKKDDKDGAEFEKKKTEYNTKKETLEKECVSSEIYNDFGWQIAGVGVIAEIGDIDKVKEDLKKYDIGGKPKNITEVKTYQKNLNDFLNATNKDRNLFTSINVDVDVLSPVVFRLKSGSYFFGMGAGVSVSGELLLGGSLNEPTALNSDFDTFKTKTPAEQKQILEESATKVTEMIDINAEMNVKVAMISKFYLGYANDFYQNDNGALNVGGRVNLYKATLAKEVTSFKKYVKDELSGIDSTDTIDDDISTDNDDNKKETSMVGLDLGVSWQTTNYNLGMYIKNINEPSADYPAVMKDGVSVIETYTMTRQTTLSGSVFDADNRWRLGFSYDVNKADTAVGDEYKWANISLGYSSRVNRDTWWKYLIPDWRLGINQNLAGSEITYYTAGIGLYGLNIDVMMDKRYITDSDDARGIGASVSYGFNF